MGTQIETIPGRADFLFPSNDFGTGMASVLDFGGSLVMYNKAVSPEQADVLALANDWYSVGSALQWALSKASGRGKDA